MMPHRNRLEAVQYRVDTLASLSKKLFLWRLQGLKIVFTNGCFDILHRGHVEYLVKAADLGNVMVVGINSDASVKRLGKNGSRPLQDENSRAFVVAALSVVSAAIIFDEDTPLDLIKFVEPHVLVKGADYDAEEKDTKSKKYIVGSDQVRASGGIVKTIELTEGFSTTAIENRIKGK